MILESLSNINAVSGDEDKIREFIIHEIRPYAESISVDVMGNIIAFKSGSNHSRRLMLAAHMDEVGFIISDITDKGYLKFLTVGGIDPRVLISKRVIIGEKEICGVIAVKATHLQTKSEREKAKEISELAIDIGAKTRAEAQKWVSVGDYAAFDTKFSAFGTDCYKGKALDDRVGCSALIEAIKQNNSGDTWYCFTVQEEVGCRGAGCAAHAIDPDYALVIEGTTCSDVSGVSPHLEVTNLGAGAAVSIMDKGAYSDKEFTKKIYALAAANKIPVQYKRTTMGGNDARSIQTSLEGCKTAVISVPVRYLHSPVGVISKTDFQAVCEIVKLAAAGL